MIVLASVFWLFFRLDSKILECRIVLVFRGIYCGLAFVFKNFCDFPFALILNGR